LNNLAYFSIILFVVALYFFVKKIKKKNSIDTVFNKMHAFIFPEGEKQINKESSQICVASDGKLSTKESQKLLFWAKSFFEISDNHVPEDMAMSIKERTLGVLDLQEAERIRKIIASFPTKLYSGGDGTSFEKRVIVNANYADDGIIAIYRWIDKIFGKQYTFWDFESHVIIFGQDYSSYVQKSIIKLKKNNQTIEIFFDMTKFYGKSKNHELKV